jgi:membrane protease subunit HflK
MNDHSHPHDDHGHPHPPEMPVDAGSQALTEALRTSFFIIQLVMVALVGLFFVHGFFNVQPNERAIILHFGKPRGEGVKALLGPGLHWSYPYPIDEVQKVSVTGIQKVESTVGWFATTHEMEIAGTEPPAGPTLNPALDGYTLTADANIIHARSTLSYHVVDPRRYVFGFVDASNVVQNALNNAIVYASANFKVDDILTKDKVGFQAAIEKRAIELLEKENIGVVVDQCDVQTTWPRQQNVRAAFSAVLSAQIDRNKLLQDASTHTNQVLTAAVATSNKVVNLAEAQRVQYVSDISSRATNFLSILPLYKTNANLFVQQRFNETMGRVLTNVQEKIFVSERMDGKTRDLWLLLNREPAKPSTATNQ